MGENIINDGKVSGNLSIKISANRRYNDMRLKILKKDLNILRFQVKMVKLFIVPEEIIFSAVGAMSIKIGA